MSFTPSWDSADLVLEIKRKAESVGAIEFKFVEQQCNRVAHWLTYSHKKSSLSGLWKSNLPVELQAILALDFSPSGID